jgi:hypothetical protein
VDKLIERAVIDRLHRIGPKFDAGLDGEPCPSSYGRRQGVNLHWLQCIK